MKRILILFAHPRYEQSRTNQVLVKSIPKSDHITFNDLYEAYPDFNIDIEQEKELMLQHDVIIWHHPLYWYNAPPLLKQWIDMVLEFEWAYGPGGTALEGKTMFNAITSGGPREVYSKEGRNRYTIREFLAPFEQTVRLCHMRYLPPFAVQGTHRLTREQLNTFGVDYGELLNRMLNDQFNIDQLEQYEFLNDWLNETKTASL